MGQVTSMDQDLQEIGLPRDHSYKVLRLLLHRATNVSIDQTSLVWVFSHFNSSQEKVLILTALMDLRLSVSTFREALSKSVKILPLPQALEKHSTLSADWTLNQRSNT